MIEARDLRREVEEHAGRERARIKEAETKLKDTTQQHPNPTARGRSCRPERGESGAEARSCQVAKYKNDNEEHKEEIKELLDLHAEAQGVINTYRNLNRPAGRELGRGNPGNDTRVAEPTRKRIMSR
jgi:hypothetical protein